jgi:hypothetical protein
MAVLSKGSFSINLGIVKLGGELSEEDRQCAWELYTELSTRVAVTGKLSDIGCKDFSGELYIESLSSLYNFFHESRKIMRKFPVGRLEQDQDQHLGTMINRIFSDVLRPFLEKWQVKYRHWWEYQSNPRKSPFERQDDFPELEEFLNDWFALRWLMRKLKEEIAVSYQLVES